MLSKKVSSCIIRSSGLGDYIDAASMPNVPLGTALRCARDAVRVVANLARLRQISPVLFAILTICRGK